MSFINIEIKARTNKADSIRVFLLNNDADFKGVDDQVDTYFKSATGRLKLRQGNIENSLIYYEREDAYTPKQSNCTVIPVTDGQGLKSILSASIGVKTIVKKKREIYFIQNVKFHLDSLEGLGNFVEIEASNKIIDLPVEKLKEQCNYYMKAFDLKEEDLVHQSYSDMILSLPTSE